MNSVLILDGNQFYAYTSATFHLNGLTTYNVVGSTPSHADGKNVNVFPPAALYAAPSSNG